MDSSDNDVPEWFSNALAAPCEVGQIDVDGCPIAYRRWGNSNDPGVVLVHGGGAHAHWWDHIGPLLADGRCVTAMDLSGHGDSGWRDKYSWEIWGRDVEVVASQASFSSVPPVIIGHSMGGRITLSAAATMGHELGGIVLVDVGMGVTWARGQILRPNFAPRPHRYSATEQEIVERFRLRPAQPVALPYVFDHVARTSFRETEEGFTWKIDPLVMDRGEPIPDEILSKVECRFSMIRCENGRMKPNPGGWFAAQVGRPVPIIELALAYHSAMFDQPLALIAALRAMLSEWGHHAPYGDPDPE